ncbi:class I SAM-dependent methyltransferase [Sterolibacterium denitrificans]|uniref:class I SAM-dependent methyltransferase n=1 Tax=Sterolibacterium denitrificans TaxID=157592 RepID=UPI0018D52A7D|nr:methyltransferase [Sterolibacterium denitrificans]
MPAAKLSSFSDPALETLLLPFRAGDLRWPAAGEVLFMRARAGAALHELSAQQRRQLVCEQSFKPDADALAADGLRMAAAAFDASGALDVSAAPGCFPLVMLLPPRSRDEARALLAAALQRTVPGGTLLCCQANNAGARSGEADLARLAGAGTVRGLAKQKCRVYWTQPDPAGVDAVLLAEWAVLDAPRRIADGRFLSRPGLFAWSHVDAASALLARCLPADLAGRGADLGAGFGYLAAEVALRCPAVRALDLYEAEARGLALARQNLAAHGEGVESARHAQSVVFDFFWHDVTTGLAPGRRYDFIVSNPPFHRSRADAPEIGQAFLAAAAAGLRAGGRFWLVANRHLPYEATLRRYFRQVREICCEQGYKVIEAVK